MGSNLKKFRSLKLNIKITSLTAIVALGFVGTYFLNNFLKEIYSSRKFKLENIIEKSYLEGVSKINIIGKNKQCNAHNTEKLIAMLSKLIFKVFFT